MSTVAHVLPQPTSPATAELCIPTAPGLWLVAWNGLSSNGTRISATGVATGVECARARCQSEWAERAALSLRPDLWRNGQSPAAAADDERTVATARAIEEVVERYAAALWLAGDLIAAFPSEHMTAAATRAAQEWQRPSGLPFGLCDLSPAGLGAVCLAWAPRGPDALFGIAAAENRTTATRAAIRELTQMEFAHTLDEQRGTNDCACLDLQSHLPFLSAAAPKAARDRSAPTAAWEDRLTSAGVTLSTTELSGPFGRTVVAFPIELPQRYDGYSLWSR